MVTEYSLTGYAGVSILNCTLPPYITVRDVATFKKGKGEWKQEPDMEVYQKRPQNQGVAGKV